MCINWLVLHMQSTVVLVVAVEGLKMSAGTHSVLCVPENFALIESTHQPYVPTGALHTFGNHREQAFLFPMFSNRNIIHAH